MLEGPMKTILALILAFSAPTLAQAASREALVDQAINRFSSGSLAFYMGCAGYAQERACLRSRAGYAKTGNTIWVQFSTGECVYDVYFNATTFALDEYSSARGFSCGMSGGN